MAGLNAKVFLVSSCIVFAMTEYAVAGTCVSSSCMVAKETVLLQLGAQEINGKGHRRPHGGPAPVPAIKPPAPMALPEQEENEEKMEEAEKVCCEGADKSLRKVWKRRCVSTATMARKQVPMKRCDEALYVEIANGASTCPSSYQAITGHDVDADVLTCQQAGAALGKTWDRVMYPGDDFPVGCFGHSDGKVRLNTNTAGRPSASDIRDYSVICIQVTGAPAPSWPPIAYADKYCVDYVELNKQYGDVFPDAATCVKKGSKVCKGDYVFYASKIATGTATGKTETNANGKGLCDCCDQGTSIEYSNMDPKGNVYKIERR